MTETHESRACLRLIPGAVSVDIARLTSQENPASRVGFAAALSTLGVLESQDTLVSYSDVHGWKQGGSETYVSTFQIVVSRANGLHERKFVAKAATAFGRSADDTVDVWLRRQTRLLKFGVGTPRCFRGLPGVLIQEFIDWSFPEWISEHGGQTPGLLLGDLLRFAERIDAAGFRPISLVDDLRTDSKRIILVDLGEDLGEYCDEGNGCGAVELTRRWLSANSRAARVLARNEGW